LTAELKSEIIKCDYEYLSLIQGDWPDLKFVRDLPIRYLSISLISQFEFDLDSVLQLTNLNGLQIKNAPPNPKIDLSHMSLEKLFYFCGGPIQLPSSLRVLDLVDYRSDIDHLFGEVDNLSCLTLRNLRKPTSINGIEKFDDLINLTLDLLPNLESVEPIVKLQKLKSFTIDGCKKVSDVDVVADLIGLVSCNLSGTGPVQSLSFLDKLTELEELSLGTKPEILDGDLKRVLNMPKLRFCTLHHKRSYNLKYKEVYDFFKAKNGDIDIKEYTRQNWSWWPGHSWLYE